MKNSKDKIVKTKPNNLDFSNSKMQKDDKNKSTTKKTTKKPVAKKTQVKKAPTKKTTYRKDVVKKPIGKKTTVKKMPTKKTTEKISSIKKKSATNNVASINTLERKKRIIKDNSYKFFKNEKMVEVDNIVVSFPMEKGSYFDAVKNVSFNIYKGEIVGLVGESGSGKSTIGKTLLGLNSYHQGNINVCGEDVPGNSENFTRKLRRDFAKRIQYIFQNPAAALNPSKTIRTAIHHVIKDNYPYGDYKLEIIKRIFDESFSKVKIEEMFSIEKQFLKEYEYQNTLIEEEKNINDRFFKKLSRTNIEFKTLIYTLSKRQVAKELNDKEYLKLRRSAIRENKISISKINKAFKEDLDNVINKKEKTKKTKELINSEKFEKKLLKIVVNKLSKNEKIVEEDIKILADKYGTVLDLKISDKFINKVNKVTFEEKKALYNEMLNNTIKLVSFPEDLLDRMPDSLSGGQQQRVVIGRAISIKPNILVADEPIAALDVSIQSQIINMIKLLRNTLDISILFIAHDLNVVRNLSDRILVMYRGHIVEEGTSKEVFENPKHPYTKNLLQAIPDIINSDIEGDWDSKFKLEDRKWFQLTDTHKVFCTEDEANKWKV